MQNNSKLKYFFILLAVILVAVVSYFTYKHQAPYKVLTPENAPAGTTVSLYNTTPPNFPKEVILENKTLKSSSTVKTSFGVYQVSVSYISDQLMNDLFTVYKDTLTKNGWQVVDKTSSFTTRTLVVGKNGKIVIISISTGLDLKTSLVSFQYQY